MKSPCFDFIIAFNQLTCFHSCDFSLDFSESSLDTEKMG